MSTVPREPNHYYPSEHAVVRHKDRKIPWEDAAATIKNGTVFDSHKENCKLFIKHFDYYEKPVGVVASVTSGEIITVEFREE